MLKAGICPRFTALDKSSGDQCALGRVGILREQIEVAERTVGWNRVVRRHLWTLHQHQGAFVGGADLAENHTREHRAHCCRAHVGQKVGWNLASIRLPQPGSREVQTMLAQGVEARCGLDEAFDHAGSSRSSSTFDARCVGEGRCPSEVSAAGVGELASTSI